MSTSAQGKPECVCRRWAFSMKSAFENEQLETFYRKAVQCISPDQHERMVKYRHRDDALACLVGRLFLRQATKRFTAVDWNTIELGRTEKGKPYLICPENTTFGINVSHQGDYVAFSSSCSSKVGVDCMRLDIQRNNKTADEYINSMAKSASPEELRMMRSQPTDQMKMTIFYRYWCLKEAICKATGEGIPNDLSTVDFRVDMSDRYRPGCFVTSTTVNENGKRQEQWVFEESFIDTTHSVAVCREKTLPRHCVFHENPETQLYFANVDFDFLLDGTSLINPLPGDAADDFDNFLRKPGKPF
uniref:L-aminoadipate-semialdehyde dehydrogenase-phosphopantetheinyl transferase n=1 Tax=Steinernema glaseri TaxID=37863 RepID=A0A1I7YX58_9BILA